MADTHAEHSPNYMVIFWWLAVLTAIEIGVIYLPIARVGIAVMLIACAVAKAALVALYFMHLRFETKTLGWIALTPVLIGALLVGALLPDHVDVSHATAKDKKLEEPAKH